MTTSYINQITVKQNCFDSNMIGNMILLQCFSMDSFSADVNL